MRAAADDAGVEAAEDAQDVVAGGRVSAQARVERLDHAACDGRRPMTGAGYDLNGSATSIDCAGGAAEAAATGALRRVEADDLALDDCSASRSAGSGAAGRGGVAAVRLVAMGSVRGSVPALSGARRWRGFPQRWAARKPCTSMQRGRG